ncbi:Cmx/CmrA family chloramphenicol efflux MFS transporter [Herbidospora sp. RD11066]
MPFVVYVLGVAVFAMGTSEFMLSGLLPDIARDLGVSIPAAGGLTAAFAAGMIVGAPLMALLSLRWPPRRALLAFLLTFLVAHVAGAVTTSYPVLLATRALAALATAGFLAVALAVAVRMVAPEAKGRATSILLGGVTLACVAGVPGGAVLGEAFGWRSAFWAVALLSLPALAAVSRELPAPAAAGSRRETSALRRPRVQVALVLGALVNAATFGGFTYLAVAVDGVWVPGLLALFGVGSFAGVTLGGRLADTRPMLVLVPGGIALLAGWVLFALTAAPVLAFVQGTLSFAVGSTLITRILYEAHDAPSLGGAFATSAMNVGATAGPLAAGIAVAAGSSPFWVSALLVAGAFVVAGVALAVSGGGTSSSP